MECTIKNKYFCSSYSFVGCAIGIGFSPQSAAQQAFAADGASEVFIEVGFATMGKPLGGVCAAAAEMRRWADNSREQFERNDSQV